MFDTPDFSIYVASLTDYNHGVLHGVHIAIESTTTIDEIYEQIDEMLNESPTVRAYPEMLAEEWEVHDVDNFPRRMAYKDFGQMIEYVTAVEEHGEAFEAYYDYNAGYYTEIADCVEAFGKEYLGSAKDEEDYAHKYIEDTGMFQNVPHTVQYYFDHEWFSRELFQHDLTGVEYNGTLYVFQSC